MMRDLESCSERPYKGNRFAEERVTDGKENSYYIILYYTEPHENI